MQAMEGKVIQEEGRHTRKAERKEFGLFMKLKKTSRTMNAEERAREKRHQMKPWSWSQS